MDTRAKTKAGRNEGTEPATEEQPTLAPLEPAPPTATSGAAADGEAEPSFPQSGELEVGEADPVFFPTDEEELARSEEPGGENAKTASLPAGRENAKTASLPVGRVEDELSQAQPATSTAPSTTSSTVTTADNETLTAVVAELARQQSTFAQLVAQAVGPLVKDGRWPDRDAHAGTHSKPDRVPPLPKHLAPLTGKEGPTRVRQFATAVDAHAARNGLSAQQTATTAAERLQGEALEWYLARYREVDTWAKLKRGLLREFASVQGDADVIQEIIRRPLGKEETYGQWLRAVTPLFELFDNPLPDCHQVGILLQKAPAHLQHVVNRGDYPDVAALIRDVESMKERPPIRAVAPATASPTGGATTATAAARKTTSWANAQPFRPAGGAIRLPAVPNQPAAPRQTAPGTATIRSGCYFCGKEGHFKRNCPDRLRTHVSALEDAGLIHLLAPELRALVNHETAESGNDGARAE